MLDIALQGNASAGEEPSSLLPNSSGVMTRASVQLPRQGVDVTLQRRVAPERNRDWRGEQVVAYATERNLSLSHGTERSDHHVTLPMRQRGSLT